MRVEDEAQTKRISFVRIQSGSDECSGIIFIGILACTAASALRIFDVYIQTDTPGINALGPCETDFIDGAVRGMLPEGTGIGLAAPTPAGEIHQGAFILFMKAHLYVQLQVWPIGCQIVQWEQLHMWPPW